jgi:hypothetical protein
MSLGRCEVLIDGVWREVRDIPVQPAHADTVLFQIPRAAADAVNVPGGKFLDFHRGTIGGSVPLAGGAATPPQNRYTLPRGQLAQLVSGPLAFIIRGLFWPALTTLLFLRQEAATLFLFSAGQLVDFPRRFGPRRG